MDAMDRVCCWDEAAAARPPPAADREAVRARRVRAAAEDASMACYGFFWGGVVGCGGSSLSRRRRDYGRVGQDIIILSSVRGRFLFHLSIFLFLLKDIDGWIPIT